MTSRAVDERTGELSINVGTAYIARNAVRRGTGFDPVLVAACYNAGSLRDSNANDWGLVTFGNHLDRAVEWFGDACVVLSELRNGVPLVVGLDAPVPIIQPGEAEDDGDNDDTFDELHNLTPADAEKWTAFYRDSGAEVEAFPHQSGLVSLVATYPARPDIPPAPSKLDVSVPSQNGYVISINRIKTELRSGKNFRRTVGFYQAFFDRQPIPEISGVAVERQGPGDNSNTGVNAHRRIEARSYPIFTHAGGSGKYTTYGFANPGGLKRRPWPSIRVGDTGARSGVLIHCAAGY